MLISPSQRLRLTPDLDVTMYGSLLPKLTQYDYLGLTLRNTLLWDAFVCKLCSKLRQKVGLLSRLKAKVPQHMLRIIYETTVQPVINYCNTLWAQWAGYTLKIPDAGTPSIRKFCENAV